MSIQIAAVHFSTTGKFASRYCSGSAFLPRLSAGQAPQVNDEDYFDYLRGDGPFPGEVPVMGYAASGGRSPAAPLVIVCTYPPFRGG